MEIRSHLYGNLTETPKKEIQISSSSLLNLRAELAKKQKEHKITKKTNISRLRVKGKITKEEEIQQTEGNELQKSIDALERKTKLYNEMRRTGKEDDNVLVDFLEKSRYDSDSEDEPAVVRSKSKKEWLTVEDEFGRSRLVREDSELARNYHKVDGKWVKKEDDIDEPEVIQLEASHFDSGRERRTLGVGFYQLSQDEEKRISQLEELKNLRKDTINAKSKVEQIKMKRQTQLEERKKILASRAKLRQQKIKEAEVDSFLNSL